MNHPSVVEDGRERLERRPPGPKWEWFVVGLVVGVAAASLFYPTLIRESPGPDSSDEFEAVGEPEKVPESAETSGIADTVSGFPDALVLVVRGDGQSLSSMVWPRRGAAYSRSMPAPFPGPGEPVDFDASGRSVALLSRVGGEMPGVLYAGVPQSAGILATDVTGYAWHDSSPYLMGHTTERGGLTELWFQRRRGGEPELYEQLGQNERIAAWGDWGFAIQNDVENSLDVVDVEGQVTTHDGRLLGSSRAGALVIEDNRIGYVAPESTSVQRIADAGLAQASALSQDGKQLALLGTDGVTVISIRSGSEHHMPLGAAGNPQVVWSSDGRFVVYPGRSRLWVVDTMRENSYELLVGRNVVGVGVVTQGS